MMIIAADLWDYDTFLRLFNRIDVAVIYACVRY